MNPNQQDYNFIFDNKPKKSPLAAPKTTKQRIILVSFLAGSALLLVIIGAIIFNIFSSNTSEKLTDLAASQNEIQRIMDLGVAGTSNSDLKALAQTASSTMASHKQKVIKLASDKGIKISDKQLSSTISKTIDQKLESAKNANNFDTEFKKIYDSQITSYSSKLQKINLEVSDKKIKALVASFNSDNELLSSSYIKK